MYEAGRKIIQEFKKSAVDEVKELDEKRRPTGVLCRSLHGPLVGFFFCPYPHKPQTALQYVPKCSCGLCGLFLLYDQQVIKSNS